MEPVNTNTNTMLDPTNSNAQANKRISQPITKRIIKIGGS
jgi:hypothetical protein